ncbi:MAG: preprotein translocase subunit SecA [Pseudomonadota bacterium]
MFTSIAYKIFGSSNERQLKRLEPMIREINSFEEQVKKLSDEELKQQTAKFRSRLDAGQDTIDSLLPEAFATVREASHRTLGLRPFDVQLMGGIVLHEGKISEMRTGEGKTLVATLPSYLNALSGKGVHVVTVNDYLAERDSDWMRPVFEALDMKVGAIMANMLDQDRREAYACDVTYGTNNEFGFDYLRDNMKYHKSQMAMRGFNYAIVDEVDSILIDEARTPLIISGQIEDTSQMYNEVDKIIPYLEEDDYELEEKFKNISLTDKGNQHAENLLREHGLLTEGELYDAQNISLIHHVNQALRAHKMFTADKDYLVKDDQIVLIDEFTGRMMEGRRLSDGLHQAIEAKEGVRVQNENQILASITFQNYFRLYPKLAGMTGTAMTEAAEFEDIYKLQSVQIPTNVPVARTDHDDEIYRTFDEKTRAVIDLIRQCQERHQPVLVGTTSIEKSELISRLLKKEKIHHNVLNARYHEQEAQIIAQAGKPGAVTIATNMAGRGTDIKLGGNLERRVYDEVPEGIEEEERNKRIARIQEEIDKDAQTVIEAGGLYVLATERHESRRIDNQLRGRAGRQGDPGETKFFISLQDDLMRIFGSDRMDSFLQRMGLEEGQAIVHPMISKAIERAQKKVEAMHFEARKNVLKYDDVANDQRKVIYEQRHEIMESDDVSELTEDMRHDVIADLVMRCIPPQSYVDQWDLDSLKSETHRLLGIDVPVDEWAREEGIADAEITERLTEASDNHMASKAANASPEIMRQLEKSLLLQLLDQSWKDHLLNLEHLRQGVGLRALGQKDPLNEYKTEAFSMFESMLDQLRENVTQALSIVQVNMEAPMPTAKEPDTSKLRAYQPKADDGYGANQSDVDSAEKSNVSTLPYVTPSFDEKDPTTWGKTPRNAPCPCGSGKKFKHCHGANI